MWPELGDFPDSLRTTGGLNLTMKSRRPYGNKANVILWNSWVFILLIALQEGPENSQLWLVLLISELFWLFSVLCIRQHIHEERKDFLWRHILTIYSTGWPQFLYLCASASWVLVLEACATVPGSDCILQCIPILWLNTLKNIERHYGGFGDSLSLNSVSTN